MPARMYIALPAGRIFVEIDVCGGGRLLRDRMKFEGQRCPSTSTSTAQHKCRVEVRVRVARLEARSNVAYATNVDACCLCRQGAPERIEYELGVEISEVTVEVSQRV